MTPDYPWEFVIPLVAWFALWLGRSLWITWPWSNRLGPGERTVTEAGWRATR